MENNSCNYGVDSPTTSRLTTLQYMQPGAKIRVYDPQTEDYRPIEKLVPDQDTPARTPGVLDALDNLSNVLGSHQDHLDNFKRAMQEMQSYRERNRKARRGYGRNISVSRELVDSLPLVHLSSYKHVDGARDGIKPGRLLPHGNRQMLEYEIEMGLDNFVFASFGNQMAGYEGIPIRLSSSLLERDGTLFSLEDPAIAVFRSASCPTGSEDDKRVRGIANYLKMLIPGSKFREFMAGFIATYYNHPSDYMIHRGRQDRVHTIENDDLWRTPEILIYGEVGKSHILDQNQRPHLPQRKLSTMQKVMRSLALPFLIGDLN